MATFDELVASRKEWIENVLKPWCREAAHKDLKRAEQEWTDIAGKVDTESTLWAWAWSRFPGLVHEKLGGIDETHQVRVTLQDGTTVVGFADARQSERGQLVLLEASADDPAHTAERGPFSIDEVTSAEPLD